MAGFGQDVATMTPGSAVADSLEDILTRKRNEARQSMLDSITRQSAQARDDYMRENSASLAQQREAKAEDLKAQANQKWLGGLGTNPSLVDQATFQRGSQLAPGSFRMNPATSINPAQFNMPNGQDAADPTAPAQPSPSVNAPATYQYLGSQQFQQHQQTVDALKNLSSDPKFASATPIQQELMLAQAFPQYNPEGAAARILTNNKAGDQTAYYLNEDTGRLQDAQGKAVPPDVAAKIRKDQVVAIPHAPRPQRDPAMTPFEGKDAHGNVVYYGYNPGNNSFSPVKMPPTTPTPAVDTPPPAPVGPQPDSAAAAPEAAVTALHRVGQKEPTAAPPPPLYGAKEAAALRAAFQRSGNSTNVRQTRESAEATLINSIPDKRLQADVKAIRNNKQARMMTVDQLLPAITPPDDIKNDPAKVADYVEKLKGILSILPNYKRLQDEQ